MKKLWSILILSALLLVGCSSAQAKTEEENNVVVEYKNFATTLSDSDIFSNFESEVSNTYDYTIPRNLITENKSPVLVVEVVFGDILEGVIDQNNPSLPLTPVNVVDYKVLSGETDGDLNTIYMSGGYINMNDYVNASPDERVSKLGWDELSQDELNKMYLHFVVPGEFDIKQGYPYLAVLLKQENGDYHLNMNGYGLFEKDYRNVITSSVLDLDDIK